MCPIGSVLLDSLLSDPKQTMKWYHSMFASLCQSIGCIPPTLFSQNPIFDPPECQQQTRRMAGSLECHQVDRVAKL